MALRRPFTRTSLLQLDGNLPLCNRYAYHGVSYSDIMVHRLLAAAIGADTTYNDLLDKV